MLFSLIIPVYNRPDEIRDLLSSLTEQTEKDFEVIVVEDGSTLPCKSEVRTFRRSLDVHYCSKPNSGPGLSRNYGAAQAKGQYFIFLDSDCVIPPGYMAAVKAKIFGKDCVIPDNPGLFDIPKPSLDAFGGPDAASYDFSDMQKAVSYSMTSFFTTGGIRGGGEKMDKFYPRSFNMGFSREVWDVTKGFSGMRYGEDIDMSIRILEAGFKTGLIKKAFVYHKRRTSMKSFFMQVFHSGTARIELQRRHPGSMKPVHMMPAAFTLGCLLLVVLSIVLGSALWLLPLVAYALLVFAGSLIKYASVHVAFLSILTSYTQLLGYGCGFISTLPRLLK